MKVPDLIIESDLKQLEKVLHRKQIHPPEDSKYPALVLHLIKFKAADLIQFYLLPAIAWGLYGCSKYYHTVKNKERELNYLLKANRIYHTKTFTRAIKKSLNSSRHILKHLVSQPTSEQIAISRTIILKMPKWKDDVSNKGVLLITFTETFSYFLRNINIKELAKYFYIILEPSSAGYSDPEILAWDEYGSAVIVEASERRDREFLINLGSNLHPVSFGASDWVNYNKFHPISTDKQYDAVYIANYNPVKRLHIYLKALRTLKAQRDDIKAAMVCAKWGNAKKQILSLVKRYSLESVLDIYEALNQTEVNYILNISKVNILLSLKEGSNRALFEGMFSGTPAILLEKNIGVNKDYINEKTGKLIRDDQLAESILHFKNCWQSYDPRSWAMNNISPEKTTEKLAAAIKLIDRDAKVSPNDIAIKVNQPEVCYLNKKIDKVALIKKVLHLFSMDRQNDSSPRLFFLQQQHILDKDGTEYEGIM